MEGTRQANGDVPSFVPVETILKEDGGALAVGGEKRGGLVMNMETRELFLSTGHGRLDVPQRFALPPDKPLVGGTSDKRWQCSTCGESGGGEGTLAKRGLQRERVQALRQNPSYREMERMRQRSLMQLKRQDPEFRALERERQRARMQLRRQDPTFRAMERERQRRRMQLKRRDPVFRERERAQQKTRMAERRSSGRVPAESPSPLAERDKPHECCAANGARDAKNVDDSYAVQRLVAPQDHVHACPVREETMLSRSPYFGVPSCDTRRLLPNPQGNDGGGAGNLASKGVSEGCLLTPRAHHPLLPQHARSPLLTPLPTVPSDAGQLGGQGMTKQRSSEECLECS